MRKARLFAPMMALLLALLCACGGEEAESRAIGAAYEDLQAQAEVTLTCHYGGEVRTYELVCAYTPEKSTVTLTAPAELAGISAVLEGDDLTLRYDDVLIDAGPYSGTRVSPLRAVPGLLRAVGQGYLTEFCREDLDGVQCLRAAFEITEEDGEKTLYTVWFDEADQPVRGEITVEDTVVYAVTFTSFTKEGESDGGTDAQTDLGGDRP